MPPSKPATSKLPSLFQTARAHGAASLVSAHREKQLAFPQSGREAVGPMQPSLRRRWLPLTVALLSLVAPVRAELLSPDERQLGFVALFDGQTFTGWEHAGNWTTVDGAFHRRDNGGDLTYRVRRVPDDFELRFEWKVSKGCNSGVYYRPGQYEYQVLDNVHSPYGENPRQSAAALFFGMAPSRDVTRPLGEWNEGRIVCKGTVIQHWLNGEKVIDFDYTDSRWAKEIELLRIRGADLGARGAFLRLQDHGADVWFRRLRWREIPPRESLQRDDVQPMPVPPAALVKEQARVEQLLKAKAAAGKKTK